MRFVRLSTAVFASTIAVAAATAGMAGAADSKESGATGVPKLEATATAAEACEVVFGSDAFDKAPSEGEVSPGEAVSVDVTWGTGWKKASTVEVVGCTAVDGEYSEELSTRIRKVKNDGLFVHEFTVPKDVAKGAVLCERAIVIGESTAGSPKAERLDADCFTVAGAAKAATDAKPAAAAGPAKPAAAKPAEKTGSAAPAPKTAAAAKPAEEKAAAAPAAKTAASAKPAAAAAAKPATAKPPVVAGETETKPAAAAPGNLARTGSGDGVLAVGAGLLFVFGGCAVAFGRPLRGALR